MECFNFNRIFWNWNEKYTLHQNLWHTNFLDIIKMNNFVNLRFFRIFSHGRFIPNYYEAVWKTFWKSFDVYGSKSNSNQSDLFLYNPNELELIRNRTDLNRIFIIHYHHHYHQIIPIADSFWLIIINSDFAIARVPLILIPVRNSCQWKNRENQGEGLYFFN